MAAGAGLYQKYCKLCHGPAGQGYAADNAPQLANATFLRSAKTSFLWLAIEDGRPGTPMAGFGKVVGGPLDGPAIKTIIAYLRSLAPSNTQVDLEDVTVSGDVSVGADAYEQQCRKCHGAEGKGGPAPALGNPYFLATASDGFVRYAIQHGRPGTKMRAFGDDLSPAVIDGLTRYIRSWVTPVAGGAPGGEPLPDISKIILNKGAAKATFAHVRDGRFVPAAEVAAALKSRLRVVILDARPTSDWLKSHIPGAYPVPFYDGVGKVVDALPRDGTWIIAYCACPHAASGQIVDQLREAGFRNTAIVDEGILVWIKRGYPVAFGRSQLPGESGAQQAGSHGD